MMDFKFYFQKCISPSKSVFFFNKKIKERVKKEEEKAFSLHKEDLNDLF